jgi:rRNA maturation endonuclease Nob1
MVGVGLGVIAGTTLNSPVALALGLGAGIAIGFGVGRLSRRDRCSHCITVLPPEATTCPKCGGAVAGRIQHRNQRLDHEEDE